MIKLFLFRKSKTVRIHLQGGHSFIFILLKIKNIYLIQLFFLLIRFHLHNYIGYLDFLRLFHFFLNSDILAVRMCKNALSIDSFAWIDLQHLRKKIYQVVILPQIVTTTTFFDERF